MKKHILLAFGLFTLVSFSFGQDITERIAVSGNGVNNTINPDRLNTENLTVIPCAQMKLRYKKDYELVDESVIDSDSTFLENIHHHTGYFMRQDFEDFIVEYRGMNVLLYSRKRMYANGYDVNYESCIKQ